MADNNTTEKVYDLEKEEFVEQVIEQAKPSDSTEEEETKDEETEEEKEKEEESSEEETDDSEKKEEESEEKKEEDEEEDSKLDDQIKSRYGEDYEINSLEELDEILDSTTKLLEENDRLKADLEKKGTEPTFASESQKSAFEFIKDYNPELQRDALNTWASVIGMDVDQVDSKTALREQYILSRPEMARQDAIEKFERDFVRKYIPREDKFDDTKEYEEAKKDAEIDLKSDAAAARKSLKEKQKEFQYKPTEKKEEVKEEISDDVKRGIEKTTKELDKYHKDLDLIIFAPTKNKDDNFPVKFTKDELATIKASAKTWVSNPASYDKNGKLVIDWDPEEATKRASYALYGEKIMSKFWDHAEQVFSIKRAEEIGTVKPNRTSKVSNATVKELSEDEQWAKHVEQKRK